MVQYAGTHPVNRIRSSNEHAITKGRYQTAIEELISMYEALEAQTIEGQLIVAKAAAPCDRCATIDALFPPPEPAPLDAATVQAWIAENCK